LNPIRPVDRIAIAAATDTTLRAVICALLCDGLIIGADGLAGRRRLLLLLVPDHQERRQALADTRIV